MPRNRKRNRQLHNKLKRRGGSGLAPVARLMITPIVSGREKSAVIRLQVVLGGVGDTLKVVDLPMQNVATGDTLFVDFPAGEVSMVQKEMFIGWGEHKDWDRT